MNIETDYAIRRRKQQQKIMRGPGSFRQRLAKAINLLPVKERFYL